MVTTASCVMASARARASDTTLSLRRQIRHHTAGRVVVSLSRMTIRTVTNILEGSVKGRRTLFIAVAVAIMLVSSAVIAVAHSTSKRRVIGAPNQVTMVAHHDGDVRWILPGLRELDPSIFGTQDDPLRAELLPLAERAVKDGKYVKATPEGVPMPTPFSNNWAQVSGAATVRVTDVTSVSGATTQDKINATFEFTSPAGDAYRVVVKKALPEIPGHENFGGVGINALQHGATGIGTPLMPQLMAYIAFWGAADLYVNGELAPQKRFVHFMLSERVRDDDYNLVLNDGVNPEGTLQAHLIMPPVALTGDGPVDSPVPTQFTLPNGAVQPFIHIMYDTVETR